LAERLKHDGSKKNSTRSKISSLPQDYIPRGSPARATSRARFHRHAALHTGPRHRETTRSMPMLQRGQSTLMTQ
ncbi:MAG TPA: IS701 family transposase, partial [Candidatus Binatia bacterium]|nr:IS701 family transposase [Candidatus Binatia bacterium]